MSKWTTFDSEPTTFEQLQLAVRIALENIRRRGTNYRMDVDYKNKYAKITWSTSGNQIERSRTQPAKNSVHPIDASTLRYNNTKTESKANPTGSTIDHYRFNGVNYPVDWDKVEPDSYREYGR